MKVNSKKMKESKKYSEIDHVGITETISAKAYAIYESRGCCDGNDQRDWLEAEKIICK